MLVMVLSDGVVSDVMSVVVRDSVVSDSGVVSHSGVVSDRVVSGAACFQWRCCG